jgi:transcription initiation factor TFIIIB Brf1 subunit/transcription initiation factor TFIIB
MSSLYEEIWNQLDHERNSAIDNNVNSNGSPQHCPNCGEQNVVDMSYNVTCQSCGLVISNNYISQSLAHNIVADTPIAYSKARVDGKDALKIKKMQEWYKWTNDEKAEHKLNMYTNEICQKLDISEAMYDQINGVVSFVMNAIKKYDGTKRARVKDGIILVCIQYVFESKHVNNVSAVDLAKKMHLDIKYVTKAEKIILELVNKNKLKLDKNVIYNVRKPIDYVHFVNQRHNLNIRPEILKKVDVLIKLCEEYNWLLDHTPLAVGVCCLYYVLKVNEVDIDMKMFSSAHDLSIVTVMKTFNKLKCHVKDLDNK